MDFDSDKYIKDLAAKIEAWENAEHISTRNEDKFKFYLNAANAVLACCHGVKKVDPPTGEEAEKSGALWSWCELHVWCENFETEDVGVWLAQLKLYEARFTVEPAYEPDQIVVSLVVPDVYNILQ